MRNTNSTHPILSLLLCGALGLLTACAADPTDPDPTPTPTPTPTPAPSTGGKLIQSEKPRASAASVAPGDLEKLVEGSSAFAWSLYQQLAASEKGNLFYSPLSISQALAMTYAGARGNTEQQMGQTLHFTLPQQQLHPAANALDLALAQRGSGAKGMDGKGFRLHVVNAIWGQDGYGFMQPFLDQLAEHYGAGLRALDFQRAPEPSRQIINGWVAQQTENRIPELIAQGLITSITRLVLTNAVYFNAAWAEVFPAELSSTGTFNLLDGSTRQVPTMSHTHSFATAAGNGYRAVELPYDGKELSMVIVVPDAGRFGEVETALGDGLMAKVVSSLQLETVALTLPRWKFESKFRLREALKALGMTDAFNRAVANFSGINGGTEPLWIDEVVHQGYISVNEKGTEAAAATAVLMSGGAMPTALKVDRPFIFVIRDIPTSTILFVGRVMNPLGA